MGTLSMNSFTVLGPRNSQIEVCLHYLHNRTGVKKEEGRVYINFCLATVRMLTSLAGFKPQGQVSFGKRVVSETHLYYFFCNTESQSHQITQ